jgi:hypothetical protein
MWSRRNYLVATAGIAALSGCASESDGDDEGEDDDEDENGDEELPEGVSEEEFESGPVPDAYMSALSLGGEERNPDDLRTKSAVTFSEYEDVEGSDIHEPGTCCANCADYIPDKNGDGYGACAEVEGYIAGEDWCSVYEELPEPEVPEGMSEEALATADVPEEYRTAESQAGEERDPDDLQTQEDVMLMESVEALEENLSVPGQSCGNCGEFIPDKNGDMWGACAVVEGYIAVEDWCSVWESISEEL